MIKKTYAIEGEASCEIIDMMYRLQKFFNLPIVVEKKEENSDGGYGFLVKSETCSVYRLDWFVEAAESLNSMQLGE